MWPSIIYGSGKLESAKFIKDGLGGRHKREQGEESLVNNAGHSQ